MKSKTKKSIVGAAIILLAVIIGLTGCTASATSSPGAVPSAAGSSEHKIVTGNEAKALYEANPGAVLLDVRNQNEYDTGHIEDSTLIPVGELESHLSELPDKSAVIIVYCRSGRRSNTAYETLCAAGYTNVYDMQQVSNWPDPLVTQ